MPKVAFEKKGGKIATARRFAEKQRRPHPFAPIEFHYTRIRPVFLSRMGIFVTASLSKPTESKSGSLDTLGQSYRVAEADEERKDTPTRP